MAEYDLTYDIGHGTNTWESGGGKGVRKNGKVYEEHTANSDVGERVIKILKAHGLRVHVPQKPMSREVPLYERIAEANRLGVKLYWSSHFNAGVPEARGVCAFYWEGFPIPKGLAEDFAKNAREAGLKTHGDGIHISKYNSWTNLAVTRETNMTAVLTENGFMTNDEDFEGIFGKNKDQYRQKVAEVQAKTILPLFGIKYDPSKVQDKVKPNPKYTTAPEDRIGWVEIGDLPMNYRKEPSFDAPILRVLPAHHGSDGDVHLYEKDGFWLRLGRGWISNKGGKYATVKMFPEPAPEPKELPQKVYRVIVDGEQVGAYAEHSNILEQIREAMPHLEEDILIQEV